MAQLQKPAGDVESVLRLLAMLLLFAGSARAAHEVAFGLGGKAEAECGGHHQALVAGICAGHRLRLSIRQCGVQVNRSHGRPPMFLPA